MIQKALNKAQVREAGPSAPRVFTGLPKQQGLGAVWIGSGDKNVLVAPGEGSETRRACEDDRAQ